MSSLSLSLARAWVFRPICVAAVVLVALVASMHVVPSSDAATARATRLSLVTKYRGLSLTDFTRRVAAVTKGTAPKQGLDWTNDGCSIQGAAKAFVSAAWSSYFKKSCVRHDFGYRNLGKNLAKGLALKSVATSKTSVDTQLRNDMFWQCGHQPSGMPGSVTDCYASAGKIYAGVSGMFGQAATAFFNHECTSGALCLFDDDGYSDRRITFTPSPLQDYPVDIVKASMSNLNDAPGGFGDKTSAVINKTRYAWRLYDDSGYKDRSICVKPNQAIPNLDSVDFGDKTSSLKRLSGASC